MKRTAILAVVLAACVPTEIVPPANLAIGRVVAISGEGISGSPDSVVDANPLTGWTGPEEPYWIEVDVGELVPVARVRVFTEGGGTATVTINVGVHDNPGRQPGRFDEAPIGRDALEAEVGYDARFVRVSVLEAGGPVEITEIEVLP